jgi:hypothetical protein
MFSRFVTMNMILVQNNPNKNIPYNYHQSRRIHTSPIRVGSNRIKVVDNHSDAPDLNQHNVRHYLKDPQEWTWTYTI